MCPAPCVPFQLKFDKYLFYWHLPTKRQTIPVRWMTGISAFITVSTASILRLCFRPAKRKMKFWINDRPVWRWSVSGNAGCGNTAQSCAITVPAIKNRPHVPSASACACHHPQAVSSHRGGEKTDKSDLDNSEKLTRWRSESCTIGSPALIEGSKLWGSKKTGKWLSQGSGLTMKRIQVGNNWAPRLSGSRGRRDAVSWLFFWDISKLLGDNQAKDGS